MNWSNLKQKKWGLPLYAWAAIVAVLIIGIYFIYRRRGNANSSANQAPLDTSTTDSTPVDTSAGGGGGLGAPFSPNVGADTTSGTEFPPFDSTNLDQPVITTPQATTTPLQNTSPSKPLSTATRSTVASSVMVPSNATATSLQKTVAKVGPSAVVVPGTKKVAQETNHPSAVKATANKTGASANKAQGVFSIH